MNQTTTKEAPVTFDPFDPLRRDADRLKLSLGVREATAPLEMLRRDLERIKAGVDSVNPRRLAEDRVEMNLLTPTEHKVLRLAAEDLSNREIADRLGIDMGTVRVHFLDIRRKIGVGTREEAVTAFGEPTVRVKVPIRFLRAPLPEEERRAPSLQTLSYERRAPSLLTLVDELERRPSMETVRRLEDELLDLAEEVGRAYKLAPSGIDSVRLANLQGRLLATTRDIAQVRVALDLMERETLPMRIEAAKRSFLSATRILREDFPQA